MKKKLLIVLDGFGINESKIGNAVKLANTPVFDRLYAEYPHSFLEASGSHVGLPKKQMGNSEVGHITLGSGRIVKQPLLIINEKIKNKDIFKNEVLNETMDFVNENNSSLHIIGLLSDGGVHSSITHFYAALALAKIKKVNSVYFHFFMDGRDTSPVEGKNFIKEMESKIKKVGLGSIGTICGRYYAMDRDNRWSRIKKAYDMMVFGTGTSFKSAEQCIKLHYDNGVTDEFISPSIIDSSSMIKDKDALLFVNFRPERMKQLIDVFKKNTFKEFDRKDLSNIKLTSLFEIYKGVDYAYQLKEIRNTFGEYISSLDFSQARIAETEKYAHVTYFFDGGRKLKLPKCDSFLIPSPKVATYDLKPEMNASEVTETTINLMEENYDFILTNFANPDMVGHTGNLEATIEAIEKVDVCIGKIIEVAENQFYDVIITADHGNSEYMLDKNNNIVTSHTNNPVPFIICNKDYDIKKEGSIADVIPTIIDMMEIKQPKEMTGESLIKK